MLSGYDSDDETNELRKKRPRFEQLAKKLRDSDDALISSEIFTTAQVAPAAAPVEHISNVGGDFALPVPSSNPKPSLVIPVQLRKPAVKDEQPQVKESADDEDEENGVIILAEQDAKTSTVKDNEKKALFTLASSQSPKLEVSPVPFEEPPTLLTNEESNVLWSKNSLQQAVTVEEETPETLPPGFTAREWKQFLRNGGATKEIRCDDLADPNWEVNVRRGEAQLAQQRSQVGWVMGGQVVEASRRQRAKHQIHWLAQDAAARQAQVSEATAHARSMRREAAMKYGW